MQASSKGAALLPFKKSVSSSSKQRSSRRNSRRLWRRNRFSKGGQCKKKAWGWSSRKSYCKSRTGWIVRWETWGRRSRMNLGHSSTLGKTLCGQSFRTSHSISPSNTKIWGMLVRRRTQRYISFVRLSLCLRCKYLNWTLNFTLQMVWNRKMKGGTKNLILKMNWYKKTIKRWCMRWAMDSIRWSLSTPPILHNL